MSLRIETPFTYVTNPEGTFTVIRLIADCRTIYLRLRALPECPRNPIQILTTNLAEGFEPPCPVSS